MLFFFLAVILQFFQVSWGARPGVAMEMSCRCCSSILLPPPPPPPPLPPPPPPPPPKDLTITVSPSAGPDVNFEHLPLLMFFIPPASFLFLVIISTVCYKVMKRHRTARR